MICIVICFYTNIQYVTDLDLSCHCCCKLTLCHSLHCFSCFQCSHSDKILWRFIWILCHGWPFRIHRPLSAFQDIDVIIVDSHQTSCDFNSNFCNFPTIIADKYMFFTVFIGQAHFLQILYTLISCKVIVFIRHHRGTKCADHMCFCIRTHVQSALIYVLSHVDQFVFAVTGCKWRKYIFRCNILICAGFYSNLTLFFLVFSRYTDHCFSFSYRCDHTIFYSCNCFIGRLPCQLVCIDSTCCYCRCIAIFYIQCHFRFINF